MISVVLPTYNRADLLLGRSLPSILAQTDPDLECLVVGDGTDAETERRMAEVTDPRVSFVNLPHQAYPTDDHARWCVLALDALNYGLEHAHGDFVTTLGDDDEYTPDHNAVLLATLGDADVAYGRSEVPGHGVLGSWPPGHSRFADGAVLWRSSMGYRYSHDCLTRGLPADADLWTRMIADGRRWTWTTSIVHRYFPNRVVPPVSAA